MKLLILFGSASDRSVYEPLCERLGRVHSVQFEVVSAHRDPEKLDTILKTYAHDVVIAGAGLAAHLPGVVASKTAAPVFGIPVAAAFAGLDALLSIQQMPFGVPVLTCGVGRESEIEPFLKVIERDSASRSFALYVDPKVKDEDFVRREVDRTRELAGEKKVELRIVHSLDSDSLAVVCVTRSEHIRPASGCLHVPLMDQATRNEAGGVLQLYEWSLGGGIWVGVNNLRNALLGYLKFY